MNTRFPDLRLWSSLGVSVKLESGCGSSEGGARQAGKFSKERRQEKQGRHRSGRRLSVGIDG